MKTFKQYITEIDFSDREALAKYKAKHKMRQDTVVNVGGKETTVQKALDKDTDTSGDKKPKTTTVPHKRKVGGHNWLPADSPRRAAKPGPNGNISPPYGDGMTMMEREHEEIGYQIKNPGAMPDKIQKVLKSLEKFKDWKKAMKNAKTIHISPDDDDLNKIKNTDAGGGQGIDSKKLGLEPEKIDRVKGDFKANETGDEKKDMHKPLMFYDTATGDKYLLAGNTRLTHGIVDKKSTVPVTAIEYDSSK